jgi:germination protein M
MIKNSIKKRLIITGLSFFIMALICLIPINKEMDETISYEKNTNYLYLLNKNNLLVQTSLVSNTDDIIMKCKEIINALTINSKEQSYIAESFKQVIPTNTKLLDIKLENDLLKINFSKDILSISKELEEKMIESLIYSLTGVNNINKLMIFVEGESLLKMPNSQKDLPLVLDRSYGINKIYDISTISPINSMTLYYFININNTYKAVPVTIFTNEDTSKVEVIIKNLKSSLAYQTDLVSFLNNNTKLLDYEIEENKIKLNFNTYLLDNFYDDSLVEEVKYAISSSIKDSLNISDVSYFINGQAI